MRNSPWAILIALCAAPTGAVGGVATAGAALDELIKIGALTGLTNSTKLVILSVAGVVSYFASGFAGAAVLNFFTEGK